MAWPNLGACCGYGAAALRDSLKTAFHPERQEASTCPPEAPLAAPAAAAVHAARPSGPAQRMIRSVHRDYSSRFVTAFAHRHARALAPLCGVRCRSRIISRLARQREWGWATFPTSSPAARRESYYVAYRRATAAGGLPVSDLSNWRRRFLLPGARPCRIGSRPRCCSFWASSLLRRRGELALQPFAPG